MISEPFLYERVQKQGWNGEVSMFFGIQLHDLHVKSGTFQVKRNAPSQAVRSGRTGVYCSKIY